MGEEKFCFVLRSGLNSRLILDGLLGVRGIGCVLMNEEQEGATEQQGAQARQSERKDRRGKKRNNEPGEDSFWMHYMYLAFVCRSAPC